MCAWRDLGNHETSVRNLNCGWVHPVAYVSQINTTKHYYLIRNSISCVYICTRTIRMRLSCEWGISVLLCLSVRKAGLRAMNWTPDVGIRNGNGDHSNGKSLRVTFTPWRYTRLRPPTKRVGLAVMLTTHARGTRFRSLSGHRLSWLKVFMIFLNLTKMPR
jgi:hypothetical protein